MSVRGSALVGAGYGSTRRSRLDQVLAAGMARMNIAPKPTAAGNGDDAEQRQRQAISEQNLRARFQNFNPQEHSGGAEYDSYPSAIDLLYDTTPERRHELKRFVDVAQDRASLMNSIRHFPDEEKRAVMQAFDDLQLVQQQDWQHLASGANEDEFNDTVGQIADQLVMAQHLRESSDGESDAESSDEGPPPPPRMQVPPPSGVGKPRPSGLGKGFAPRAPRRQVERGGEAQMSPQQQAVIDRWLNENLFARPMSKKEIGDEHERLYHELGLRSKQQATNFINDRRRALNPNFQPMFTVGSREAGRLTPEQRHAAEEFFRANNNTIGDARVRAQVAMRHGLTTKEQINDFRLYLNALNRKHKNAVKRQQDLLANPRPPPARRRAGRGQPPPLPQMQAPLAPVAPVPVAPAPAGYDPNAPLSAEQYAEMVRRYEAEQRRLYEQEVPLVEPTEIRMAGELPDDTPVVVVPYPMAPVPVIDQQGSEMANPQMQTAPVREITR